MHSKILTTWRRDSTSERFWEETSGVKPLETTPVKRISEELDEKIVHP